MELLSEEESTDGFFKNIGVVGYIIIAVGLFYVIGLLCGLSIFCENALKLGQQDEERRQLGSHEELEGTELGE